MMKRSERLVSLMKENGHTYRSLANKSGVAYTTIKSMVERDLKNASIDNVIKIAKVLGVTSDYLSKVEEPENVMKVTGNFVKIPVIGEIACGDPILADENIIDYHVEPADLLPAGNLFYLKAKGDSMEPKIPNQSLVLIREQSDVESGEIAAVLVNGDTEATLKRVKKQNGYLILHPDNSNYEPMIVDENNPARIIGKALQITAKL